MRIAEGRMIRKRISESRGFAGLSPKAAALFGMMIPHFNAHGKMNGGPGYVKDEVCPLVKYLTIRTIQRLLREISKKTNVKWFKSNGRWWLHSLNFNSKHQNLKKDRMGEDDLPSYPRAVRDNGGSSPGLIPLEGEGKGEGKDKEKGSITSAKADPSLLLSNGNHCARLTTHIKESYKRLTGASLMLSKADENTIKSMIGEYDHAQLMALWDMFAVKNWDWKNRDGRVTKKIPHDIKNFREKISELLEDSTWKERMNKYDPQVDNGIPHVVSKLTGKF